MLLRECRNLSGVIIRENEPLHLHTTLRTGGPARFFAVAQSEDDLREALRFAQTRDLPLFVLGGGSNLLAGDAGFAGVVIQMALRGIQSAETTGETVEITAGAGEEWDALVAFAVNHGWHGLENLSLIPGLVGGAVIGNIGAYGAEIKDTLRWAEALDARTGKLRRFSRQECDFTYRHSFFKTPEGRQFIVARAGFGLKKSGAPNLSYQDLRTHFASMTTPTLAQVRAAVIAIRQSKLPDLAQVGTAGSFFKNPILSRATYTELAARHPGLPGHDDGSGQIKVPLGWILDKVCGLKGARQGRVGAYEKQALVLVNYGGGTAAEVEAFAQHAAQTVHKATGLNIEWEVEKL